MKKSYFKALVATLALTGLGAAQPAMADEVQASTEASPKWYRIFTPKRSGLSITSNGSGLGITNTKDATTPYDEALLWRFEAGTTAGTYKIINMDGTSISATTTTGNPKQYVSVAADKGSDWTIKAIDGQDDLYIIVSGTAQFNTSQDGPSYKLYNWGSGTTTGDEGCQYRFEYVPMDALGQAQTKALSMLKNTQEGTNPGQYATADREAFKTAVNAATTEDEVKAAIEAYTAKMIQVQAGKTYYIVSGPSADYCQGSYIYSTGSQSQPMWGAKVVAAPYAWTFEDAGSGKFYVKSYATGEYIEPNSTEMTGATTTSKTAKTAFTVKSLGEGAFNITPDGKYPIHAQKDGSVLVMWNGGLNTASAWKLEEITDEELNAAPAIASANVASGSQIYAPGNKEQVLLRFDVVVASFKGSLPLKGVKLNLGATNVKDLKNIKLFVSENYDFITAGERKATLVGTLVAPTTNEVTIPVEKNVDMNPGYSIFYVTADIADDAKINDVVDASLLSFSYGSDAADFAVSNGNPEGVARIWSVQSTPFQPYLLGTHYWRIPAMVVLHNQKDGNAEKNGRVVVMADNRFSHNGDLPNHIDVYERHSDNNGKTWSESQLVAGSEAHHKLVGVAENGFGDAALVETNNGKLIAIMVAGQAYFSSSSTNPIIPFIVTSEDGGDTWSTPRSLKDELYKGTYTQGQVLGSFAGSGRGIVLKRQRNTSLNGRIMFAMSHRFAGNNIQEYIIYSDDEGETWHMSSNSAYSGGDESKLVELADGTVMISVRQYGQRGYNTSTDGGMTWGTQRKWADISGVACNGDILYFNENVLLHSYVNNGSARKNLTVKASFDQGKTWTKEFVACLPSSGYSTMDITGDGQVAIFYEDASCSTGYIQNYGVFPIDWLAPGQVATGIGSPAISVPQAKGENVFFDLSGRRVEVPTKGIYVTAKGDKLIK